MCTNLSFPSVPSTIHLCLSNENQLLQLWLHICFTHVRLQAILATSKTTGVWVLMSPILKEQFMGLWLLFFMAGNVPTTDGQLKG